MARPRKLIPEIVGINMAELASHILCMSDSEIGAWLRKAVGDCLNGCINEDADEFIKAQFKYTVEEMRLRQEHDARMYRNRLARQAKELGSGKADTDKTNDPASTAPSASGSRAKIATTPYPSSISTNTAEDADTSNDSEKIDHTVAGQPVSTDGTFLKTTTSSAEPLVTTPCRQISADEARQSQDRQVRCTGEFSLSGLNSKADRHCAAISPVQSAEAKKPYGTCGHVMLTDAEGRHLREVYGQNLAIAIDILDAYIENNGKAAKKYKNHAAVMRKGNWVWNKVQEMVLQQARIDKAKSQPKSFKQQDLDARTQFFKNSIAERMLQNEQ